MIFRETLSDWREQVWRRWLDERQRLADSPVQAPSLLHHHDAWRELRRVLKTNPDAYRVGKGIVIPVRRGEISKIDWEPIRLNLGLASGEKLYAGFDTCCPEVFVPDHHQRWYPGTPVWVDDGTMDRALRHQARISEKGELVTRDELLSEYEPAMFGDAPDDFPAWDVFNRLLDTGTSIYDRDRDYGDQELALGLLADLVGDEPAVDLYQPFAREVVARLPHVSHIQLQIRSGPPGDPARFNKHAEWYLSEGEIRAWVETKV